MTICFSSSALSLVYNQALVINPLSRFYFLILLRLCVFTSSSSGRKRLIPDLGFLLDCPSFIQLIVVYSFQENKNKINHFFNLKRVQIL